MKRRSRRVVGEAPIKVVDPEREARLVEAEKRANVLIEKAQWLRAVMAQRDEVNGWQESVNQMFRKA